MHTGFDNIFGEGPTPSHSAMAGDREAELQENMNQQAELMVEQELDGVSLSNADGMNI